MRFRKISHGWRTLSEVLRNRWYSLFLLEKAKMACAFLQQTCFQLNFPVDFIHKIWLINLFALNSYRWHKTLLSILLALLYLWHWVFLKRWRNMRYLFIVWHRFAHFHIIVITEHFAFSHYWLILFWFVKEILLTHHLWNGRVWEIFMWSQVTVLLVVEFLCRIAYVVVFVILVEKARAIYFYAHLALFVIV